VWKHTSTWITIKFFSPKGVEVEHEIFKSTFSIPATGWKTEVEGKRIYAFDFEVDVLGQQLVLPERVWIGYTSEYQEEIRLFSEELSRKAIERRETLASAFLPKFKAWLEGGVPRQQYRWLRRWAELDKARQQVKDLLRETFPEQFDAFRMTEGYESADRQIKETIRQHMLR
jgi:hypothetical protein